MHVISYKPHWEPQLSHEAWRNGPLAASNRLSKMEFKSEHKGRGFLTLNLLKADFTILAWWAWVFSEMWTI